MNELDQYAKHTLKLKCYARYVDDIVSIGNSGPELHQKYTRLESFAYDNLDIKFHPKKKEINKIECGVNFVGFIIKPYRKYLRRSIVNNLHQKIKKRDGKDIAPMVNSYMGMLRNTNGYKERERVKAMLPDEWFDEKLTKIIVNGVDDGMNHKERIILRFKQKYLNN